MKITSKITKQQVARFALLLACLGIAALAFAVPPNQVLRKGDSPVLTGACCFSFGESVTVTEPAKITPVVVTWNTGYLSHVSYKVGIAVNGHPCQVSDNFVFDITDSIGRTRTFQWVVLPGDGLIKGTNTFTLCGGGNNGSDAVTLGFRTLTVTISK
jgi:hypothetical protein